MTNEISLEDIKESLLDKKFLFKLFIFIIMMLLFFSTGYLFAKEKGIRDGHAFASELINKNCFGEFNISTKDYIYNVEYLRKNHKISDNLKWNNTKI